MTKRKEELKMSAEMAAAIIQYRFLRNDTMCDRCGDRQAVYFDVFDSDTGYPPGFGEKLTTFLCRECCNEVFGDPLLHDPKHKLLKLKDTDQPL